MESDSKPKVENPEVIVIDCDDDDEQTLSNKNLSSSSLIKKRKVTISEVDNRETIHITQNVHVKEQRIKCVINLNTNVCDSKRKKVEHRCHNKFHREIERIVPRCFRPICQLEINDILMSKNRCCNHKPPSTRKNNRHKKKGDKQNKSSSRTKSKKEKYCKEPKKRNPIKVIREPSLSLSSVSLSPFVSDITYEDISPDSFTCCSDGELDTLIIRARERERRSCVTPEQNFEKPLCTSTPRNVIELSSDEETLKQNESIHSLKTLVLESHLDYMPYSPTDNYDIITPSGCVEECEKKSFIKNSLPTIDFIDTKIYSVICHTNKPINYIVDKNSIESKISNMINYPDELKSEQNICNEYGLKNEYLKTSPKLLEPTECKPVEQLDMKENNLKMHCSTMYTHKNYVKKEIKIEK